jgi:chaperonin GroEL
MVREVASKTSDTAGDGTTTATVLAQAIYREGAKNVAAGANPMDIKRGIEKAVEALTAELKTMSKPVSGNMVAQVGTISANNDETIGKIIADAMDKVGKDGVITVEEAKSMETSLDVVEGMQFDRGYLSPYFVTDPERMEVVLENPVILIHEKKISSMKDLLPVLEQVARLGRPLLIVAEDIEGEALATLVVNKLRGTLQAAAVKAPGSAIVARPCSRTLPRSPVARPSPRIWGSNSRTSRWKTSARRRKVTIDKDHTTIVEGAGTSAAIEGRVKQLRAQVEDTTVGIRPRETAGAAGEAGRWRRRHQGRGGHRDRDERKEGACRGRDARDQGGCRGGHRARRRRGAPSRVEGSRESEARGDQQIGVNIVARAIEEPMRWIATNAGQEGSIVVQKVREMKDEEGFNALTDSSRISCTRASSTRPRSCAQRSRTRRPLRRCSSPPKRSSARFPTTRRKRRCRAAAEWAECTSARSEAEGSRSSHRGPAEALRRRPLSFVVRSFQFRISSYYLDKHGTRTLCVKAYAGLPPLVSVVIRR